MRSLDGCTAKTTGPEAHKPSHIWCWQFRPLWHYAHKHPEHFGLSRPETKTHISTMNTFHRQGKRPKHTWALWTLFTVKARDQNTHKHYEHFSLSRQETKTHISTAKARDQNTKEPTFSLDNWKHHAHSGVDPFFKQKQTDSYSTKCPDKSVSFYFITQLGKQVW